MQISLKTLQDFCRTCLQDLKQRPKCNIHGLELELRQWLQDSTLENPMANDTHSNYICHLCRSKLEELLEFRKMCERSRKTVTDILEKEKQKPPDIDLNFDEEKDGLDENQDWLDFDFVIPYKIETTICNKEELDIEDVEPYICNLQDNKKEPDHIEYFDNLKHKVEPQNEDENNENSEKDHEISGSEYDIKENDEQANSDSDFSSSDEEIIEKSLTECPNDKRNSAKNAKTKKPIDKTKTYNYKCNECDRRCLNEQTLNNHMRTHQGLKPYQCPKCNRSYNKSTHLREHLKEVHAKEKINIICEYEGCGKQFHRTESYKSHYRLKHVVQPLPIDQAKLQHICEDCGKTYKNLASLKKHQYTHKSKDEYPFQCTICDKAFTTQYGFDEHQLRHAGVKKFECPYCGMKKTTKHELQTHINYHTKEKQWHCPRCPMVFNSSGNLRLHEQIIHQGIRRWSCQFCEESFGKKDALKHHEMRHTGEKPHVCTQCGRSFIQKYALKTHMKTHNKYLDKHKAEQSL